MLRRARWCGLAILLGIFGGRGGPNPARADDEPEAPAPATEEPLELQWYSIGVLTAGRTDFTGPRGPFPVPPDRLGDDVPFGSIVEESTKPFGSITDIIDLVRQAIPASESEREGFSIEEQGTATLRVRAPRATLSRIEAFLLELERDSMRTVTLDAVVVRGDPSTAGGPRGLADAVARGSLEALMGVRAVGMQDQVVAARTGGEVAHLAEQDVEVAIDAKGTDPIVGVVLDGLAVRAQLASVTDTRARGILQAWWAAPARLSTHRGAAGEIIERPEVEGRSWNLVFDLVPSVWTLLPSTGGLSLAVRLTVATRAPSPGGPAPLARLFRPRPLGPLEAHRWDLGDLGHRIQNFRGSELLRLDPSNFTPPEPPELPEPASAYPGDELMDLLRRIVGEAALERDGASLSLKNGTLWGTLDRGSIAEIDHVLAEIRKRFLVGTRLRGTVISLPLESFPEYLAGLDDGATLFADGGEALMRRPGARVVDRCALRLHLWQRAAIVGGTQHSYVADYDIEIAEKSVIGNPIVRAWLEGLSLDVLAERSLAGDAVWCEMRLQRSTERETRQVPTPYGAIECPSIGVQRVFGSFALPVGGSRIVAAHLEGEVVTLVIVSAVGE